MRPTYSQKLKCIVGVYSYYIYVLKGAFDDKDEPDEEDSGIEDEDEEFLEADDTDEPPIERITVPPGKPFVEVRIAPLNHLFPHNRTITHSQYSD